MPTNHAILLGADKPLSLKSTLTFTSSRARPPPANWYIDNLEDTQLGQHVTKVAQRESKIGLRSMFSRNKVDPDMKHMFKPMIEEPRGRSRNESSSLGSRKDTELENTSTQGSSESGSAAGEPVRGMRFSMMPRSRSSKPILKQSTKPANKTTSMPPRRTSAAWDPPPLFQAYPQAIKHAQLMSSTSSADSILRVSNHKRNISSRDDTNVLDADVSQISDTRRSEKMRTKHRRRISASSSKSEWTEKIYVLVTSGYLLQYSGEGSFDRLPEKMMQLGKDSVAFASDVIPGKHWVLQISQAMDIDGTPSADARSLMSRLSFRSTDYRRNATSLLLILESAEELESWITTVRREIEALGGKKYVSETGKPIAEDSQQLRERPSLRYLVMKDPGRFSNPPTPREPSSDSPWGQPLDLDNPDLNTLDLKIHQSFMSSTKRVSIATSSGSHDSQQQESSRDNSYRLSYMSSGQRTLVTSQGSSPTCSPTQDSFKTFEESQVSQFTEEIRPRPNATAISERRRSMQMIQNPAIDSPASTRASYARPHSIYSGPGRNLPTASAITPKFTIPHSGSKPHIMAKTPEVTEIPDLIKPNGPEVALESTKTRRGSSQTLSAFRPLSSVLDSPPKVRQPLVYSPASLQNDLEKTPLVARVSTYPSTGSPSTSSPSAVDSSRSFRHPSITPPTIPIKSPRRYSMQQAPRPHGVIETPTKKAAQELPPHMVPLPPSPPLLPLGSNDHVVNRTTPPSRSSAQHPRLPLNSKPRRPASMQVLSQKITPTRQTIPPPNGILRPVSPVLQTLPHPSLPQISLQSAIKPPLRFSTDQHLKQNAKTKRDLRGPRSMPQLLNGPPPAPPPNCALPPIPARMRNPLAVKDNRNSLRV